MLNIIIPTYKARNTLPALFDSLVAQTSKKFLVTVVQDCDGENYDDIFDEYERRGLHIYCLSTEINSGPGIARQVGVDNTNMCDYVMFMDSDDLLLPQTVEVLYHEAKMRNADIISSTFLVEQDGKVSTIADVNKTSITWTHGKIYRTQYLKDNNIRFIPELRMNEDAYFNLIALNITKNRYKLDFPTYIWRNNKNSLTRKEKSEAELESDRRGYILSQLLGLKELLRRWENCNYGLMAQTLLHIYRYYQDYLAGKTTSIEKRIIVELRDLIPKNLWENQEIFDVLKNSDYLICFEKDDRIQFYNENFKQWFERLFFKEEV